MDLYTYSQKSGVFTTLAEICMAEDFGLSLEKQYPMPKQTIVFTSPADLSVSDGQMKILVEGCEPVV